MNQHLIQEIVKKNLLNWSNLDLQYNSEYEKVEKELTDSLMEAYALGKSEVIEEVEKKIKEVWQNAKEEHICRFNDGEQKCDCYYTGLSDIASEVSSLKEKSELSTKSEEK